MRLKPTSAALLAVVVACSEPTATHTKEPPPYQKPADVNVILLAAVSPTQLIVKSGAELQSPPSVRVYNTTVANPVAGATVLFTLMNPDGTVTQKISVVTGRDGIATLPSRRVGESLGRYWTVAEFPGASSVDFFAYVRGSVVGIYDLVELEGENFPGYASEGHFILFEDGTYNHVYNSPVSESTVFDRIDGTFTKDSGGVIAFYISPPSSFFGSLFAEARPYNGKLRVTYSDYIDYSTEIYAAR